MDIKNILQDAKEKPTGILIISIIFMFFGLLFIVSSLLFIALALSIISPIEGVISATGGNGGSIIGIFYFGVIGFVQVYVSRGIWRFKIWARDCALILAGLALISIVLDLLGKYTGFIIEIALLPKFKFPIICLIILLLIIFILFFETYKGTFQAK